MVAGCDGTGDDQEPENPVTFNAMVNGDVWRATATAVQQEDGTLILSADQYSDQVDDADAVSSSDVQVTSEQPFVRARIRIEVPDFAGEGTYDLGEGVAQYFRIIGGDVLGTTATSREGTLRITTYDNEAGRLEGSVEFAGRTDRDQPFTVRDGRFRAPILEGPTPMPGND
jgi:hypothetical protein